MKRCFGALPLRMTMTFLGIIFIGCSASPRAKRIEAIKDLQQQIEVLKQERADTHVKVDDLKTELQIVSSKVEELQHFLRKANKSIEKQNERIDQLMTDYDQRIKGSEELLNETIKRQDALEKKINEASSVKQKISIGGDFQYDFLNGIKKFKAGNYDEAVELFERYLTHFPKGKSVEKTKFFMAESLFKKKEYEKSILKYEEYKEKFSKGSRVAEAIYKQALAFKELGKKADAKVFFEDLISSHPQSEFSEMAKGELKRLK